MPIRYEIVSQDRAVAEGEADIVVAPGSEGVMGILPHHAPLLTSLKPGELIVRRQGVERVFAISGGFMEVRPDIVTVLADAAEAADEIDVARAEAARARAEAAIKAGVPPEMFGTLELELRKANLRLSVARRHRRDERRPGSFEN